MVPPAYQPQAIHGGLYVLINKKARTLIDLGGGTYGRTKAGTRMIDPPSAQVIRHQALPARVGNAMSMRKLTTSSG